MRSAGSLARHVEVQCVRIVGTILLGDGFMMFRHSKRLRLGSHRKVALHRMISRNSHVNVTTSTSICLNRKAGNNLAIVSTFECHVILRPVRRGACQVETNRFLFTGGGEDWQGAAFPGS